MPKIKMIASPLGTLDTRAVKPLPKTVDPHYSTPEHRRWRDAILRRAGGRCEDTTRGERCANTGRLFANHIVELRDGGAPFDLSNGLGRCGACHSRKTAAARAARMAAPVGPT